MSKIDDMKAQIKFRTSLSRAEFDEIIKKSKNPKQFADADPKEVDEFYQSIVELLALLQGAK